MIEDEGEAEAPLWIIETKTDYIKGEWNGYLLAALLLPWAQAAQHEEVSPETTIPSWEERAYVGHPAPPMLWVTSWEPPQWPYPMGTNH